MLCPALLVTALLACAGCGEPGASGVSLDEAKAQAASCQSLIERHGGVPIPQIDPQVFRKAMSDPRLATRSTADVVVRVCRAIERHERATGSS